VIGVAQLHRSLFEPFDLAGLRLPNRIVMAPMTRYFSPNGIPGENVAAYYRRRAEGGTGLIFTEGSWVPHPGASNDANAPRFYGEDALAGWRRVVSEVHAAGGRIMPQLWHVGLALKPAVGALGLLEASPLEPQQVGPSGMVACMNEPQRKLGRPMSSSEIGDVICAFAKSAAASFHLGFDGVALHAAHGYLIDQFFWHETNLRSDDYGGSLANRARFAAEVVAACKTATAPGFPLVLRLSQWKVSDFGAKLARTPDELEALLAPLVDAGVDAFDCSQRRFWIPEFDGSSLNLAGWVKRITGKPTITVGSVGLDKDFFESFAGEQTSPVSLEAVAQLLERGECDLVAVGRSLIADPSWADKIRNGRLDEIVRFTPEALRALQ
jgi:2,4-dienoyl-CoA reductase-like NADH-dependent reductase (Old Yellow Enzyme family)